MSWRAKLYRIRGLIWLVEISAVVALVYYYIVGSESWAHAFIAFLVAKLLLKAAKPESVG